MKIFLFFLICLSFLAFTNKEKVISKSVFCSCFDYTENNICNLKESVDFIAIGTIIESTHSDYPDGFTDVKFKIDSLIKGPQTENEIFINQFEAGNCSNWFEVDERYVILGNQIRSVYSFAYSLDSTFNTRWRCYLEEEYVIETSGCISAKLDRKIANLFLKEYN
ncbi:MULTISPECIES: hypothetical protein [Mesonia]|uniref:Uncharacterized protein n=1 Tax=Mesonia oceanica TaxID=2687242 RepID=A0AC61Y9J1_9FLAO|nr:MULTISPECIES: hypothetical protein [Mesonia]MAN27814.1 hypothetical protein [Mesonia sp.]MAQ40994.1 hypothetical protein [Mesonia sp.]MBJ96466.1 hypothetical protein [Flavobacteriaceae bacterium]VVV01086.1 hypothetical protein FVB9532_02365 [Mesonia oceanica]